MSHPLDVLARKVEDDPFFLAPLLAEYARLENLDDIGLSAALGCRVEDLNGVRLCRAPRTDPREFREDVERVAARFRMDPRRLTDVVKQARVVGRMRQSPADSHGFLMAARDREGPPPEKPEEEKP